MKGLCENYKKSTRFCLNTPNSFYRILLIIANYMAKHVTREVHCTFLYVWYLFKEDIWNCFFRKCITFYHSMFLKVTNQDAIFLFSPPRKCVTAQFCALSITRIEWWSFGIHVEWSVCFACVFNGVLTTANGTSTISQSGGKMLFRLGSHVVLAQMSECSMVQYVIHWFVGTVSLASGWWIKVSWIYM